MNASSPLVELTPRQVRAGRALLAWSQRDLAKAAGIGSSTLADFERGSRTPIANNVQAIRAALEAAGIVFRRGGAVVGPAAPSVAGGTGIPVRWVSAQALSEWADRIDGAVSLPTLIAKLIRAGCGSDARLRFPSDEGVRYPGWDGITDVAKGNAYVPTGRAGWELSAQRSDVGGKATRDYEKRTADPALIDPGASAYVVVTLRRWPGKDAWAEARRAAGPWREVRVYDADDLVHWIEQHPAVGLWIAVRLDKRPPGTRELDEVWDQWSLATEWRLSEDLVLADRSEDAAAVLRWLQGGPSVLSLQANAADEVVAFFHATLSELPDDRAAVHRARTLVVTTAEAARAVGDAPGPLILLLTEPDPGLAGALVKRGHFVLQAYGERPVGRGEVRALARPSRDGVAAALQAAGMAEPRARALARDSARNLAILRRLIPGAPGRLPAWAEVLPPKALLAALLAGGWDETSEGDCARLAELAGRPYDAVVADLAPLVGAFDSPLQKVGSAWRVASPSDAWVLLARHLIRADLDRFEDVAQAVLGAADPRFDVEPDERWKAGVRGIRPSHSGLLRHGIGQVLILLALWGDRVHTVCDAPLRAKAIVNRLLHGADARRWWSLSDDVRLLAEASPEAFLDAVEDSLDRSDPPIGALFGRDGDGIFGTEHLSNLMWALETLAWSPDWMARVTHVLTRLDAIDVQPRKLVDGPMNSLRELHQLWNPQTYATQDQRIRALDRIRKREPGTATMWKLMLGILPSGHGVSTPSPLPRWRDFSCEGPETVTWDLIGRGAEEISERLIRDSAIDVERWSALLDRLGDLRPDPGSALDVLEASKDGFDIVDGTTVLWGKVRGILHRHRQFPDADWTLPEDVLQRLGAIYERFAPEDPLARVAWLFDRAVTLPRPAAGGWQAEQREVEAERVSAIRQIYEEWGGGRLLELARMVDNAGYIGKALYDIGLAIEDVDAVIEAAARSDEARERGVAHGLIVTAFLDHGESWAEGLIAGARGEVWGDEALMTILRALPIGRWTWDQVAQIGGEMQVAYWKGVPALWVDADSRDTTYAVRQLIDVGRARHALALVAHHDRERRLPSGVLLEVLEQAARQPVGSRLDGNESTMFQYYVTEALTELDSRDDVDRNALAMLEWNYLQLLEHSRRPAKALLLALSEQPELFIKVLSALFRPSEESGIEEPERSDPKQARAVAGQAFRLLEVWNHIPGRRDDGIIDGEILERWIKKARVLAKAVGREQVADSRIGHMLSASPEGTDGNWPAEPVREALDLFRSKSMLDGFCIGKMTRRGVTTRMVGEGGGLERAEATNYRSWAKAVAFEHPYTAKTLGMIAEHYDKQAKRQDEDVELMDWLG